MDEQTQRALGDLNRDFYERHASAFAATRDHPWPGWQRVLDATLRGRDPAHALRILDVGCGNARLADFAQRAWRGTIDYVGIDASEPLLAAARARCAAAVDRGARVGFVSGDVLARTPAELLAGQQIDGFDLCCAFGLMHHVPGHRERRRLLAEVAGCTRSGGRLAVSFWDFERHERFRRRFREGTGRVTAASGAPDFDVASLELGDHLLAWGDDQALRYCHAASDDEIRLHIADLGALGMRVADDFSCDGREGNLNRYLVFERTAFASR